MKQQGERLQWFLFTLFLFGFTVSFVQSTPPTTLRLVSVIYRHGDRSPSRIYPKDRHQYANTWPDGKGWLTNTGKRQQFELGKYLKKRYSGFINTTRYTHNEIRIESSAKERCLMSAYANLAGLFVPKDDQVWNDDLLWQPVPVFTKPKSNDPKLAQEAPCPMIDKLYAEQLASPAIVNITKQNKEFFAMIEKNTGIKKESIADMWEVADALICEKAHKLQWNDWAKAPGVYDKVVKLGTLSLDIWYNTPPLARLTGGVLLKELKENMKEAAKTSTPSPKFYMYSAHDSTVASVLSAMLVWDSQWMDYASMLMVELHKLNNDFEVRLLFRNDTARDPYVLQPPGCGNPCMLDRFIKVTEKTTLVDWDKECAVPIPPHHPGLGHRTKLGPSDMFFRFLLVVGVSLLCRFRIHG